MSELQAFVEELSKKLDDNSVSKIEQTLKANGFTTRLQIKLISDKDLETMFHGSAITMGAKNLLSYQIQLLRDESPLVKSKKKSSTSAAVYENIHTTVNSNLLLGDLDGDDSNSDDSDSYDRVDKQPKSKGVSTSLFLSCSVCFHCLWHDFPISMYLCGKICKLYELYNVSRMSGAKICVACNFPIYENQSWETFLGFARFTDAKRKT